MGGGRGGAAGDRKWWGEQHPGCRVWVGAELAARISLVVFIFRDGLLGYTLIFFPHRT